MTVNINAKTVHDHLVETWNTCTGKYEGKDRVVYGLFETIEWLHNVTRSTYPANGSERTKFGHFRQIFTVWQAACRKELPWKEQFAECDLDYAVKAYPTYFKTFYRVVYLAMHKHNVFLGVRFSREELEWVEMNDNLLNIKILEKLIQQEVTGQDQEGLDRATLEELLKN